MGVCVVLARLWRLPLFAAGLIGALAASAVLAAACASPPTPMRYACANGEWGRLHYVADPKQCTHGTGTLVSFEAHGSGPIYVCVTTKARALTLDRGRQRVLIPAGATWSASGPGRCNPQRQSQLALPGDAAARFCAATQGGLLRRQRSCGAGEFAVMVPARGGSQGKPRGCKTSSTSTTTSTTTSSSTKSPTRTTSTSTSTSTTPTSTTTTSSSSTTTSSEPPNEPPQLTLPGGQTLPENSSLTFSEGEGNRISVQDPDADGGVERLTLSVAHGTLQLPPSTGLTSSSGDGTDSVQLEGTIPSLDEAVEGLLYTPSANFHGSDSLEVQADDLGHTGAGGAKTSSGSVALTVTTVTYDKALPDSYSVRENETLEVAAPGVLGNDTDSDTPPLPLEVKEVTTPPQHGTVSLQPDGALSYTPDNGFYGQDSFEYDDTDGNSTSNAALVSIEVEEVDQAPVNTVPVAQTLEENATLSFSSLGSNAISVEDVDADGGAEQVTLSAGHGALTPGSTGSLASVSGSGTATLVLEGTISALDEALEGLTYTAESHYAGQDTLTIETDDLGHTGLEGPKTTSSTVAITVLHVNEPPTLSLPGSQEVDESTNTQPSSLVFSSGEKDAITVGDPDADGGTEQVSLKVEHGTLKLGGTIGLASQTGNESSSVAIEGTIAALNEALEGLEYRPTSEYSGSSGLAVEIDDSGHTGSGGAKTASGDVAITVRTPVPVPTNPTYNGAIGNTDLYVGVSKGSSPGVEQSGSVLPSPATEADGSTLTIKPATISTKQGGSVAMSENGTFTYTPPVGFENGTDTFPYTEMNSRGGEATGTASIKVDDARVWYVNDSASSNGDGESGSPFNTLSSVSGSSGKAGSGDHIFLYGGGPTYGGGIEMQASQTLTGEDEGLDVEGEALFSASGSNPTITNAAGAGIKLAEGDNVEGVSVSGTADAGIAASGVSSFMLDSRVSIGSTTGDGLEVSGGSGTITDEAAIKTSSAHALAISGRSGGTVTVSGAIEDTGTGISLSSNAGASIAFSGKLTLSTGTHTAFDATGGGTVIATGAGSTASTSTATALEVESTTIGALGLKFQSISAGTASSGPGRGIVLVKTGSSGGLDVTGTGSAGSGGTVQHTTATDSATYGAGSGGVYLKETSDVTLTDMDVASNKANGIYGTAVNGLSIAGLSVSANGESEATEDSGIRFDGLAGTASIASTTASGSPYDEAMINSETSGSLTLAVKHSTFGPKASEHSDDGLDVEAIGTAAVSLTANEEDTFKEQFANGLETRDTSSGTMQVTVEHDSFTGNAGTGMDVSSESGGTVEFLLDGNTLIGQQGSAINLDSNASSSGTMVGTVSANNVGNAATPDSGSKAGSGIALTSSGSETMTADVRENKIVQIESGNGINAAADQGSAKLNLTLAKNEVHTDQATSRDGVEVDSGALTSDTNTMCLNAAENTFVSSGTEAGNKSFNTYGLVLVQQGASTKFEIQGYTGSATSEAEIATYLNAHNSELKGTEGTVLAEFQGGGFTGGTCPTAP